MMTTERSHASEIAWLDAEATRRKRTFANAYRVLDAIALRIRRMLRLGDEYAALEVQADAIFDLIDAGRDLPQDVADVLEAAHLKEVA